MEKAIAGDPIADGVSRQVDPRWITVRRVHGLIFTAIVAVASFTAIVAISVASQGLWPLLLLPALYGWFERDKEKDEQREEKTDKAGELS